MARMAMISRFISPSKHRRHVTTKTNIKRIFSLYVLFSSDRMSFQVCYVTNNDESHSILEDVCTSLGIEYTERYYSSFIYSVDRNFIERLPAFHIFEGNTYAGTYYPDKDIDKIESLLTNYTIRQMKRKNSSWKRILSRWLKTDSKSHKKQRVDIPTTPRH